MKKLTIIALVVAMAAIFAVTASANEWNLYGNARMATFYTSEDLGLELGRRGSGPPFQFFTLDNRNAANQNKEKNTIWELNTVSQIGANIKGDRLEARFEFGVTSDGSGGNVSSRRLYAIWKFAEGWGLHGSVGRSVVVQAGPPDLWDCGLGVHRYWAPKGE